MVLESGQQTVNNRPWRTFYGEMPVEIDYPSVTLYGALAETAAAYPRRSVYDYLGHRRTYRSFLSEVGRIARGLWALGVRPGARICSFLPNSPQLLVLLYAANRIGAVLAVLDADAEPRLAKWFVGDLRPMWAVVTTEHAVGFQRVAAGTGVRGVVISEASDYASPGRVKRLRHLRRRHRLGYGGLRSAVGVSTSSGGTESLYELPPTFSWQSMRKLGIRHAPVIDQADLHTPDECAVVLYTGGLGGGPRGVRLSDRNLDAAARQLQQHGPILPGQRVLSVVPFSHGLGLGVSGHTAIVSGAETVLLPYATVRYVVNTLRRKRPDYLVGVPSFYARLMSDRRFRRMRLSWLMGAFVGGERVSAHLRDSFEILVRRRGGAVGLREGYGLTETVAACVIAPDTARRDGSVGVPVPDTDIRIVMPGQSGDAFVDVPAGELGELCVAGPTVMLGYLHACGGRDITSDSGTRWLRTGDLCRVDADGFVYFVDRMDRGFPMNGRTVYPGVAEAALNNHPEVKRVCVTGSPTDGGQLLTAHVEPIDWDLDHDWMEGTLRSWCEAELDEVNRPSLFVFTEALPETRFGVVDYRRVHASVLSTRG